MAALTIGKMAPNFSLIDTKGEEFSLEKALNKGPVLLAFFKISCPVCQFAVRYLERLHQALKQTNVSIISVSQNNQKDTEQFLKTFGGTYRTLLDSPRTYPVSNAFGITNVPTLFYVSQSGQIEISSVGWSRADVEQIARKAAEDASRSLIPLIGAGEKVPDFRAG